MRRSHGARGGELGALSCAPFDWVGVVRPVNRRRPMLARDQERSRAREARAASFRSGDSLGLCWVRLAMLGLVSILNGSSLNTELSIRHGSLVLLRPWSIRDGEPFLGIPPPFSRVFRAAGAALVDLGK
jgi:hypothetical protein